MAFNVLGTVLVPCSYDPLTGFFRLCPAGHRRNYVQCRTMSRAAVGHPLKMVNRHGT